MTTTVFFAYTILAACPASDVAEIVEQAQGAARVTVLEVTPSPDTTIRGQYTYVRVEESYWGSLTGEATLWSPVDACGGTCDAPELIVGYRTPSNAQREHLKIPEGVLMICGSQAARQELGAALSRLKQEGNADNRLELLSEEDPAVRRQAFRLLKQEHLLRGNRGVLSRLVPRAAAEKDPELLASYLSAFGHFRYAEASGVTTKALLGSTSDRVTDSAEAAFHRVARPESIAQVIAAYGAARLPLKGRILRALARVDKPEARLVLETALRQEETFLPALNALYQARRRVGRNTSRVERMENNGRTP